MITDDIRRFLEAATLLFIASRNARGELDVSPRGGLPHVLWRGPGDSLLLPDYRGNNRLDTFGNVLARPEVTLLVLARGDSRALTIRAHSEVSFAPDHLSCFPSDESPALAALVLHPTAMRLEENAGVGEADLWIDPVQALPPLDLRTIVAGDRDWNLAAGRAPVPKRAEEEVLLQAAGIRARYGVPSEGVKTKVTDVAGPGVSAFLDEASCLLLAGGSATGPITLDLVGGRRLQADPASNRNGMLLPLPDAIAAPGEPRDYALIGVVPGRCEALRLNGTGSAQDGQLKLRPREIFFHCSAALRRSRVWQDGPVPQWTGQRRFRCTAVRDESPDVRSFVLAPCDRAPVGRILPGQYVPVSLPDDPAPVARRRSYSVSGRGEDGSLRITVRRVAEDGFSGLLHRKLVPGGEVGLGTPGGHFTLRASAGRPVVLISAGVGITPLLPMLAALVDDLGTGTRIESDSGLVTGPDMGPVTGPVTKPETGLTTGSLTSPAAAPVTGRASSLQTSPIWFFHGARDVHHHLFAEEAQALSRRAAPGRVQLFTAYSRPDPLAPGDHQGRLSAALIADLAPVRQADVYLCGPRAFMEGMKAELIALGAAPDRVRYEAFTADQGALPPGLPPAARVHFRAASRTLDWTPARGSLLDLALAEGVAIPHACRIGDCGSCAARVLSGQVAQRASDTPGAAPGQALLCQAFPLTDIEIGA